jgi:hypothetical protein
MLKRAAFAFSLLLCTSAFAADEPKWLRDARAREAKSLKPAEIQSKDGWFKVRTPGKLVNTIEKVEGSYSVQLEIGDKSNVHCEIFPEGIDLANGLRVTLDNALKAIESTHGKIEARGLEGSDAGSHGPVPYISLSWLYRVAGAQGGLLGNLKQFVMEKGKHGVYCVHDDLGYNRTFAAITQAFAESLETQEPAAQPHFVEISTATMSGTEIGVAISTLVRDSEGDTQARQSTSLLIATNDGAVQSQDSTQINWIRPDGSLINAVNTDVSNGELSNSLALKHEEGGWLVEGEVQGKAVKTSLPKDAQPGNWLSQAQQLRTLLAEPNPVGRDHSMGIWLGENPAVLTVAKTRILARQGDKEFTARGEIGNISANLTLDKATGTASGADLKVGPVNMKLERVYVSGSL